MNVHTIGEGYRARAVCGLATPHAAVLNLCATDVHVADDGAAVAGNAERVDGESATIREDLLAVQEPVQGGSGRAGRAALERHRLRLLQGDALEALHNHWR